MNIYIDRLFSATRSGLVSVSRDLIMCALKMLIRKKIHTCVYDDGEVET